jgi:hypothetical protein
MKNNQKELYQVVGYAHELLKLNPIEPVVLEAMKNTDSLIYGGYVRDLIAKKFNPHFQNGFNDIDIVCLSKARGTIYKHLTKNGYSLIDSIDGERYSHWGSVASVYTLAKEGYHNVQLACVIPKTSNFKKELLTPIISVDIRCCAVAISSNMKILQLLPLAVDDCKNMKIVESKLSSHKNNIKERIKKLQDRGWKV